MNVRIAAFARIREIVGGAHLERDLPPEAATIQDAWNRLAREFPALHALRDSTRFARNGALVSRQATLHDGDELALLPPSGGG